MIEEVIKRDGKIAKFERERIENAIRKALRAVGKDEEEAVELAEKVIERLQKKEEKRVNVEEIQDVVEEVLMESGFPDVARVYILYREKRRALRESKRILGVEDDLKLSLNAVRVLQRRYLLRDEEGRIVETPRQMLERVARTIAEVEREYGGSKDEMEEKFFHMMKELLFLPNSPTLMNAGTRLGQLSACFVIPVEDSIEGIFLALRHMALIHQSGGGTGFSFSRLRPRGDVVRSTGGIASGPISFMRIFDTATHVIKQGGRRRGANMGILSVHHPDILEFITAKDEERAFENFNLSVAVTDTFMDAYFKGETYPLINPRTGKEVRRLSAREVFDLIAYQAWKRGDPGIIWIDEINRHNPTPHVGKIEATNPCVAGDTFITTDKGMIKIKELVEKKNVKLLTDDRSVGKNGVSFRNPFQVLYTGKKKVMKVITRSGFELTATLDHLVLTQEGWVAVKELKPGRHRLFIQREKGSFPKEALLPPSSFAQKWSKELGWIVGWLIGDGWLRYGDRNARVGFCFGKDDEEVFSLLKESLERLYGRKVKEVRRDNGVIHLSYHSPRFAKFFIDLGVKPVKAQYKEVPESLFTAPEEAVKGFLSALFSADGTVHFFPGKSSYIRLTSKSKKLLQGVQLLLLNLGINSRIMERSGKPRISFVYRSKKGEKRSYSSHGFLFELEISRQDVKKFLKEVGFIGNKFKEKIDLLLKKGYYKYSGEDEVLEVKEEGIADVYDIIEPHTHSFLANGIVVHNCGEQPLLPYESCNLGSINLARMVENGKINWEKLKSITHLAVQFLDNVIDANRYPIPEVEKMTLSNRKIGLGVMGFAELLIKLGIPYDSEEAEKIGEKIIKFIHEEAIKKSAELGEKRGSFPNFKGSIWEKRGYSSMRNATLTTIAPTGTLSIIAGTTSGIEPLFAVAYFREVLEGSHLFEVNEEFLNIALKRGFYSRTLIEEVLKEGSLKNIKGIPEDVKRIFVTSLDISPEWHVRIQAIFQKHTDNAVSKTINFPPSATPEKIKEAFLLAYHLKCKGLTVYRYGSKRAQVHNIYAKDFLRSRVIERIMRVSGYCRKGNLATPHQILLLWGLSLFPL